MTRMRLTKSKRSMYKPKKRAVPSDVMAIQGMLALQPTKQLLSSDDIANSVQKIKNKRKQAMEDVRNGLLPYKTLYTLSTFTDGRKILGEYIENIADIEDEIFNLKNPKYSVLQNLAHDAFGTLLIFKYIKIKFRSYITNISINDEKHASLTEVVTILKHICQDVERSSLRLTDYVAKYLAMPHGGILGTLIQQMQKTSYLDGFLFVNPDIVSLYNKALKSFRLKQRSRPVSSLLDTLSLFYLTKSDEGIKALAAMPMAIYSISEEQLNWFVTSGVDTGRSIIHNLAISPYGRQLLRKNQFLLLKNIQATLNHCVDEKTQDSAINHLKDALMIHEVRLGGQVMQKPATYIDTANRLGLTYSLYLQKLNLTEDQINVARPIVVKLQAMVLRGYSYHQMLFAPNEIDGSSFFMYLMKTLDMNGEFLLDNPEIIESVLLENQQEFYHLVSLSADVQNQSILYLLLSSPNGLKILSKYPQIILDVSAETLNAIVRTNNEVAERLNVLTHLMATTRLREYFARNSTISERISTVGLNTIITDNKAHAGASALIYFSSTELGVRMLTQQQRLVGMIEPASLNKVVTGEASVFRYFSAFYYLAAQEYGRQLLLRFPQLVGLVTRETLNYTIPSGPLAGRSAFYWLASTVSGQMILQQNPKLLELVDLQQIDKSPKELGGNDLRDPLLNRSALQALSGTMLGREIIGKLDQIKKSKDAKRQLAKKSASIRLSKTTQATLFSNKSDSDIAVNSLIAKLNELGMETDFNYSIQKIETKYQLRFDSKIKQVITAIRECLKQYHSAKIISAHYAEDKGVYSLTLTGNSKHLLDFVTTKQYKISKSNALPISQKIKSSNSLTELNIVYDADALEEWEAIIQHGFCFAEGLKIKWEAAEKSFIVTLPDCNTPWVMGSEKDGKSKFTITQVSVTGILARIRKYTKRRCQTVETKDGFKLTPKSILGTSNPPINLYHMIKDKIASFKIAGDNDYQSSNFSGLFEAISIGSQIDSLLTQSLDEFKIGEIEFVIPETNYMTLCQDIFASQSIASNQFTFNLDNNCVTIAPNFPFTINGVNKVQIIAGLYDSFSFVFQGLVKMDRAADIIKLTFSEKLDIDSIQQHMDAIKLRFRTGYQDFFLQILNSKSDEFDIIPNGKVNQAAVTPKFQQIQTLDELNCYRQVNNALSRIGTDTVQLRHHLQTLKSMPAPDAVTDVTEQLVHSSIYTLNALRVFQHLAMAQGKDSIFRALRNLTRHAYEHMTWAKLHEMLQPILDCIISMIDDSSLNQSAVTLLDFILPAQYGNKLEKLAAPIQMFKDEINNASIGELTKPEREIIAKKHQQRIEKMQNWQGDPKLRMQAIVMSTSVIGEALHEKGSKEKPREIYRKLGHEGFKVDFNGFIAELYHNYCIINHTLTQFGQQRIAKSVSQNVIFPTKRC